MQQASSGAKVAEQSPAIRAQSGLCLSALVKQLLRWLATLFQAQLLVDFNQHPLLAAQFDFLLAQDGGLPLVALLALAQTGVDEKALVALDLLRLQGLLQLRTLSSNIGQPLADLLVRHLLAEKGDFFFRRRCIWKFGRRAGGQHACQTEHSRHDNCMPGRAMAQLARHVRVQRNFR